MYCRRPGSSRGGTWATAEDADPRHTATDTQVNSRNMPRLSYGKSVARSAWDELRARSSSAPSVGLELGVRGQARGGGDNGGGGTDRTDAAGALVVNRAITGTKIGSG